MSPDSHSIANHAFILDMRFLVRAVEDAWEGQLVGLFLVLAGGGVSLLYLYVTQGGVEAAQQVPYFIASIVGAVGGLLLWFLPHLVAAPYRVLRDERDEAREQLKKIQAEVGQLREYDFLDLDVTESNLGAYVDSSRLVRQATRSISAYSAAKLLNEGGWHGLCEHALRLGYKRTSDIEHDLSREYEVVIRLSHFFTVNEFRRSNVLSYLFMVVECRRFEEKEHLEFLKSLKGTSTGTGFVREMRSAVRGIDENLAPRSPTALQGVTA
jgi:hypothetical protein